MAAFSGGWPKSKILTVASAGFSHGRRSKESTGLVRIDPDAAGGPFFRRVDHGHSATPAVIPSAPHRRADRLSKESWPGGMDEASDEALMGRIARGDETAFRLLARRYAARAI